MALKTAKLCFDVEYDDRVTTPTKLAKVMNRLFDFALHDADALEDHASDTHGTPGVGLVEVDKRDRIVEAAKDLLDTGSDEGCEDCVVVSKVEHDVLHALLWPPVKPRKPRKPKS